MVRCAQAGQLKDRGRSFSQCMGCSSENAFCQLSMIQDAAVINHAPVGCAGDFSCYNFVYRVEQMGRKSPLRSADILAPTSKKKISFTALRKSLERPYLHSMTVPSQSYLWLPHPAPQGLLEMNAGGVTDALTEQLGIPVVVCICEGFRTEDLDVRV